MQYLTPGEPTSAISLPLASDGSQWRRKCKVLEDWEGDETCNSAADGGRLASFLHGPALSETEPVSGEWERPEAWPLDSQYPECFQEWVTLMGKLALGFPAPRVFSGTDRSSG